MKHTNIFTLILLCIATILIAKTVIAACSNTDTYTVNVYAPGGTLIKTGSEIIDPIDGTDCNTATSNEENLYIYCQTNGTYTAEITCAGCTGTGHDAIGTTPVLLCHPPEDNKFVIRNQSGDAVAAFDEKGYLYLRGFNHSHQSDLSPTPNSFVIKNNTGFVVAYINSSGSLHHTGNISINQSFSTAPVNSFVIQNKTEAIVSYIDSVGTVYLEGQIYFNWTGDI